MKTVVMGFALAGVLASSMTLAQQPKTTEPAPPLPADLEYETFCKKTQQEKRSLFRAATPAQKAVIGRRQMERFRDANRARLTKEQLSILDESLKLIPASLFEGDAAAQAQLEALSDRIERAFTDAEQDQMDRDGPCIPKA